jgi:hypothetical protein
MWHDRDQRPIDVARGHADYDDRANLGGHAEIDQPEFASAGRH